MRNIIKIKDRLIGSGHVPLVIAEIGINHNGSIKKAFRMVDDAFSAGCECVKFQSHIIEDEMIPNNVIPGNADESIWDIIDKCKLGEKEEIALKKYVESKCMIFLSTPFSRAAADRLDKMDVAAYKIGSGECNNYPLVEHIAGFGKPIILSTGMNDISSIKGAVNIIRKRKVAYAVLHCTSIYPTPYGLIRLGALEKLKISFPDAVLGLSDHSQSIYPCLGAVALGASILEKHFVSDKKWAGPDVPISVGPKELKELIRASRIIFSSCGGTKNILKEEKPTIDFAYACVVAVKSIFAGEKFTKMNIWVKRPGTGEIKAKEYFRVLGKKAKVDIQKNEQIQRRQIGE